jgi:hypothetical protein
MSDAGSYFVQITNTSGSVTSQVAVLSLYDLAPYLDAPGIAWRTGGAAPWVGQSEVTHDGLGAARSGLILDAQDSWLETEVTGPGGLALCGCVLVELYGHQEGCCNVCRAIVLERSMT